jgi:single-stranded-DNA-specific exonuclease
MQHVPDAPRIRWRDAQAVKVPQALKDTVGGHPLVAETLARRGVLSASDARDFLDPDTYIPALPQELPDLSTAADCLREAIRRGDRIAVWGDLDADGQTSTALLLESLRALHADVIFHVPTRDEGHGLHIEGIEDLLTRGTRVLLTCDTGATAHASVAYARARGAQVLITDHHVLSERLPDAAAIVNPHRLPAGHALSTLSGVGVAYELASSLDAQAASSALDLVALGMVADVTTLTGDARYLVQRGLAALRQTSRKGLKATYERAAIRPEGITEDHIGFVLGPRLNAWGRLGDPAQGVELLTTDDWCRARSLATEMEALHARRQWLTDQVTRAALAMMDQNPSLLGDHHALVLSHPSWPSGISGIVAGRLAERFGKPAVLIASAPGQLARGSGRSVPGVDLIGALAECAPMLENFGGHVGAAGFTIQPVRVDRLRTALSQAVARQIGPLPDQEVTIDAYVEFTDLTQDLVADISRLAPFGPGNPPLTLAVLDLRLAGESTIGRAAKHRRLTVEDRQGCTRTVFWWHGADRQLPHGRFDLAISIRASDFRGLSEVQIEWLNARERKEPAIEAARQPPLTVRDYRGELHPEFVLSSVRAEGDTQVWAEGIGTGAADTRTRLELVEGHRLAIWTLPPGPQELAAALALVGPDELMLFAHDPGPSTPETFIEQLAGLVKFALAQRQGEFDVEAAAARTAQRHSAVQAGLSLLSARGTIVIVKKAGPLWKLAPGNSSSGPQKSADALALLHALLEETAAYRSFVARAPVEAIVQGAT